MKTKEAIYQYAVIALLYKKEIVDLINQQNLGSLSYASSMIDVNGVLIDNLENKEFLNSLDQILYDTAWERKEYLYEPITITMIVIASLIVVGTGVKIGVNAKKNREMRDSIRRENRRTLYLSQEELDEVTLIERKGLINEFLVAQGEFLQDEEIAIQQEREKTRKGIIFIVIGGIMFTGLMFHLIQKRKNG
tara:strand:- start:4126 stop:4701 length:576 start_codon:yes stop_codon:yes gene_type:complete